MATAMTAEENFAVPTFTKITPVLVADDVEACVRFWNRLGIKATMTLPFGEETGFAALASGNVELMYQSFAMASAQDPKAIERVERAIVYLEVSSLAEIEARLGDAEVVVPVRDTGHGTRELYVRDPAGNLIGFAEVEKTVEK
ncbi:MAG: VOC family protein [Parvularculaceae bacterium]